MSNIPLSNCHRSVFVCIKYIIYLSPIAELCLHRLLTKTLTLIMIIFSSLNILCPTVAISPVHPNAAVPCNGAQCYSDNYSEKSINHSHTRMARMGPIMPYRRQRKPHKLNRLRSTIIHPTHSVRSRNAWSSQPSLGAAANATRVLILILSSHYATTTSHLQRPPVNIRSPNLYSQSVPAAASCTVTI